MGEVEAEVELVQDVIGGIDGNAPLIVYGYTEEPNTRNTATPEDSWEVHIKSTGDKADATGAIYVIAPSGAIYINGNFVSRIEEGGDGTEVTDGSEIPNGTIDGDCKYDGSMWWTEYPHIPGYWVPCTGNHNHPTSL